MIYSRPKFNEKYDNFINGEFTPPVDGTYFDNYSPIDKTLIAKYPRSNAKDINLAVAAANAAKDGWAKTSVAERAACLHRVADVIEKHLEEFALVECCDNGKPIRETLNADIPLSVDHWRYFASVIRAEEGSATEIDANTLSLVIKEPLGVVGQIIPWNFPLLMLSWKMPPALAAGNCVILKPAEQTPATALLLMEKIADIFPKGVVNVVCGFGEEAGQPLASHPEINKVAFTGETKTGQLIMEYAAKNLNPVTMELGGKSPNLFFDSVMDEDDEFLDKAVEGAVLFAFNQGEVCTCPSRLLIQEGIYDRFLEKVIARTKLIKRGNPYDTETMVGSQVSEDQYKRIHSYLTIAQKEGAKILVGEQEGMSKDGYYIEPTIIEGTNDMQVFQEEIFGPVVTVTKFKDAADAIAIANDSIYGLGAGVWTRDAHQLYQVPRAIQAGRVWANCYHVYPAHTPFGGYKKSGFGRETHLMMLDHYQQSKNILVSYDKNKLGFY